MPNKTVKAIMADTCKVVSQLIGSKLSQVGSAPNNLPAVFIANTKPPKPTYPYVTISDFGVFTHGNSTLNSFVNSSGGLVQEFSKTLTLSISVYDKVTGDCTSLCDELRDLLRMSGGMDLYESVVGHPIMSISGVTPSSVFVKTDFEESARMTIDIHVINTYVDALVTTIDQTQLDGSLGVTEVTTIDASVVAPIILE